MARIVVLGSSGYDLTIRLPRIPAQGETVLGGPFQTGPGGKGANAAIAAKRAGAEVLFLTALGDDEFGRKLIAHDQAEGLDLTHAKIVPETQNQVALILIDETGQNLIGVAPGASALLTSSDIDALPDSVFQLNDLFLASLELPIDAVTRGLSRANHHGLRTVLNPAPANRAILAPEILCEISVLTPNQEEVRALSGQPADTVEEVIGAAQELRHMGVQSVVVTLGERGCVVVTRDHVQHIPGHLVEAVDTVGAGDAFNGALAVALAEGQSVVSAARWACAAGALAVTKQGAQGGLPRREQIDSLARCLR